MRMHKQLVVLRIGEALSYRFQFLFGLLCCDVVRGGRGKSDSVVSVLSYDVDEP